MIESMTPEEVRRINGLAESLWATCYTQSCVINSGLSGRQAHAKAKEGLEAIGAMILNEIEWQRAQAVEEYKADILERAQSEMNDKYPGYMLIQEIYRAFGWQGGTIHQILAEIKQLKSNDHQISEPDTESVSAKSQNKHQSESNEHQSLTDLERAVVEEARALCKVIGEGRASSTHALRQAVYALKRQEGAAE